MNIKVLGSSSKGNCMILECGNRRLILDVGFSYKRILEGLDFDLTNIDGVLLTHEHGDHAKGIPQILKNGICVYSGYGTLEALDIVEHHNAVDVKDGSVFETEGYKILPFCCYHDAAEPLGFLIKSKITHEKALFISDTSALNVKFKDVDVIILECNYINSILEENISKGFVAQVVGDRLAVTHMSLDTAKAFLKSCSLTKCKEIILAHLSNNNSNAREMVREVQEATGVPTISAKDGMILEI